MSICAPAWVPLPKLSCTAALLICGANPKWTPRFRPASLPVAENVAKAGSSPVRTLEFAGPLLFTFENTQKAFTFPPNWNDHPLDICIVRPCAPAVAETPSAKPNNNSVRRFIRDSLLGSLLPPSYRSCPRGAYATARARYSRVGRFSHQYSSGFSSTVVCELTGESGAHLLESESIGTPRSREAEVSPQEWPPTTACELSPKPRDEPTCRPPRGPEPRKILDRTPPYPQQSAGHPSVP